MTVFVKTIRYAGGFLHFKQKDIILENIIF